MLCAGREVSGSGNPEPLRTGHHTQTPLCQFPAKASSGCCRLDASTIRPKMELKF